MAMFHGYAAGTDIPIANLDYGYIKSCNSSEEVEKILQVLRSGSEGVYPNLIETAEQRLRLLNPQSKLLIKDRKAKTLTDLSKEEAAKWSRELSNWADQLKKNPGGTSTVEDGDDDDDSLPPIRKPATITGQAVPPSQKPTASTTKKTKPSSERIKSRDYHGWDKFVSKELNKNNKEETEQTVTTNGSAADGKTNRKREQVKVNPQLSAKERELPFAQKQLLAAREKDKGNEAFRSGDYTEAMTYYSRSIELSPSAAAYNNRAMAGLKMEKFESAMQDCTEVLKVEPHNTKALFRRATAFVGMKSFAKAIADYEHLLQLEPNNKKAQLELNSLRKKHPGKQVGGAPGDNKPQKKGRRIQIQEVNGSSSDDEESSKNSSQGNTKETIPASSQPSQPPTVPNLVAPPPPIPPAVKALKDKGNDLFQRGQYGDAILLYTRAIKVLHEEADIADHKQSHSILLNNRAACHFKNGDCRQTIKDATDSISLRPLNFKALVRRAQAYEVMEKYRRAYTDYQMAMTVDPRSDQVRNACNRLSRILSEMDGREWRSKVPAHPEEAAIMEAFQQQYSFTSTEVTQVETEETVTQVDGTVTSSSVTAKSVVQIDETIAITNEGVTTTEISNMVESDTVTVVSEAVKDQSVETEEQPFEEDPDTMDGPESTSKPNNRDDSSTDSDDQSNPVTVVTVDDTTASSQPLLSDTAKTSAATDEENEAANLKIEGSDRSDQSQAGSLSQTPPSAYSDEDKDTSTQTSSDEAALPMPGDTTEELTPKPNPLYSTFSSSSDAAATQDPPSELLPSSVPIVTSTAATSTTNVTQSTEAVTSSASTSSATSKKQERKKKKKGTKSENFESGSLEERFENWKNRGNEYVKKQDYSGAIRCYSVCASFFPTRALIYTNRALCYLKTNDPQKADDDCSLALTKEPGNVKALYRRGLARKAMMRYGEAVKDLKILLDLDPENTIAKREFAEVKQLWERELRELQSKKTGGSTSPSFTSKTSHQPNPFSTLGGSFRPKDGSAPPSGIRESRADRRRNSREARTAMRNLRRVARQLPSESAGGPVDKERLQSLLEEIQSKVGGQEGSGRGTDQSKRPGKDKFMTAGKTTYYDRDEGKTVKSEGDPFGLRGAREAGEVNRAAEKGSRGQPSKASSKKSRSGGSKRKKITVTVRERSSDEEDAVQHDKVTDTDPSSPVDVNSKVTTTDNVEDQGNTDSDVTITPNRPNTDITPDSTTKGDEETPVDITASQTVISEDTTDVNISQEVSTSTEPCSVELQETEHLEDSPDQTSDQIPDTLTPTEKTITKPETTLKPATPYEFVQRWNSVPRSSQATEYAKLLEVIPPATLPQVITNKLDGIMLTSIISAVDKHFIPNGNHQLGADILQSLTQVQRFGMVSMFLSSAEKRSLENIFSTISEEGKAAVEVDRLRALYGVK